MHKVIDILKFDWIPPEHHSVRYSGIVCEKQKVNTMLGMCTDFSKIGCAIVKKSNPKSKKKVIRTGFPNPRTGYVMWVNWSDDLAGLVDVITKRCSDFVRECVLIF